MASYPHHLSSTGRETTVVLLTREHVTVIFSAHLTYTTMGLKNYLKFALGAGKQRENSTHTKIQCGIVIVTCTILYHYEKSF